VAEMGSPYRVCALEEVTGLGFSNTPLQARHSRESGRGALLGWGTDRCPVLQGSHPHARDLQGPRSPLGEARPAFLGPRGLECRGNAQEGSEDDDELHGESVIVLWDEE
jgi:hypothetical protein